MLPGRRAGVDLMLKEKFHDPIGNRPSFHRLRLTPPGGGSGGGGGGGGNDDDDDDDDNNNNNTNHFKNKTLKGEIESKCRLCKQHEETIDNLNSGCPVLRRMNT